MNIGVLAELSETPNKGRHRAVFKRFPERNETGGEKWKK